MSKLSVFALVASMLAALSTASALPSELTQRATGGYVQNPSGSASFTMYSGCGSPGAFPTYTHLPLEDHKLTLRIPACGISASGFTAAVSQLAFGAAPGAGAGDACGRCFAVTATQDPFSPSFTGPFKTVVVKVTDECPAAGNQEWCGQTQSNPTNEHGAPVHFDLCEDTGAATSFFPSGKLHALA
jgi:hypothetical protein